MPCVSVQVRECSPCHVGKGARSTRSRGVSVVSHDPHARPLLVRPRFESASRPLGRIMLHVLSDYRSSPHLRPDGLTSCSPVVSTWALTASQRPAFIRAPLHRVKTGRRSDNHPQVLTDLGRQQSISSHRRLWKWGIVDLDTPS